MTEPLRQKPSEYLAWIDCEMTQLTPDIGQVLEVALIVTDRNLQRQEVYHSYVQRTPADLESMSEFAKRQFLLPPSGGGGGGGGSVASAAMGLSGHATPFQPSLFQQCIVHGRREEVIDEHMSRVMDRYRGGADVGMLLCGSSVHTDRAFLTKFFPKVAARLHYQHLDVTSWLRAMEQWCPLVLAHPARPRPGKSHSALADIEDTLALAGYFRDTLLQLNRSYAPKAVAVAVAASAAPAAPAAASASTPKPSSSSSSCPTLYGVVAVVCALRRFVASLQHRRRRRK